MCAHVHVRMRTHMHMHIGTDCICGKAITPCIKAICAIAGIGQNWWLKRACNLAACAASLWNNSNLEWVMWTTFIIPSCYCAWRTFHESAFEERLPVVTLGVKEQSSPHKLPTIMLFLWSSLNPSRGGCLLGFGVCMNNSFSDDWH